MLEFNGWFDQNVSDDGYRIGRAFWEDFDYGARLIMEKGGFCIEIESMKFHFSGELDYDVWHHCNKNGLKVIFHSTEVGPRDYISFMLRDI